MSYETERKFLVASQEWRPLAEKPSIIRQGYLNRDPERVVRIRQIDDRAFITIKNDPGKIESDKLRRAEFEYAIPLDDAMFMLENLCLAPIIYKKRYRLVGADGTNWEIDEFVQPQPGLVIAEVELKHSADKFEMPGWLGAEVTLDPRYANNNIGAANLA